jgi:thiamine kinase-like enzyme
MNHSNLINLCNELELGIPLSPPKRVHGGLLHTMWRINTEEASYAIKQLSPDIKLKNKSIIENYNLTEEIATRFVERGIPAICALKPSGKYLVLIHGTGFLIYPWVDAKPLHKDTVSKSHALKIAEIIAQMHLINLAVPEIKEPEFDIHTNDSLEELFSKAQSYHCPFAAALTEHQKTITTINTNYQNMLPLLKQSSVVSHGDLDQKNVLWDKNDNPILIDWECARKLNPTYEIVNASLDWSGITTHFNQAIFIKMIQTYSNSGGHLDKTVLEAAFNAVLGNWINWMVYNIERACTREESEQKTLGIEQVNQVLQTMIQLINIIPDLIASFEEKDNGIII